MLTTIELNSYSYLVVDEKGNEVGQIHHAPTSDEDEHPWKVYSEGIKVFEWNSFMRCFRHIQETHKQKKNRKLVKT